MHPAIIKGGVAVVTGAAVGIGFAIAQRVAREGMAVVMFDRDEQALEQAGAGISRALPGALVKTVVGDVTSPEALDRLKNVAAALGPITFLVNNAAVISKAGPWERTEVWKQVMDINFWAVLSLQNLFVPIMLAQSSPAAIVNLGSKEGITTPPGNAAYNVSKAALRVLTEQMAHELRERTPLISAHLLIPGYTFTPMNFPGMTATTAKPDAPWTADQVAERLMLGLSQDEFYIFCQDNEVTREMDQRRMQWSADDLILNRPALSRWHPNYRKAFAEYLERP
ncbi:SDR family NAD(P)-dependent oxidoreductase [Delftia sp. WSY_7]|uniref:SDR family NAD(P)-dependent oxidoreductase n=1 Tax=Delftia sp. WSY_7 TaxID=3367202 RepID=UPI00370C4103